jgi:site-specific recombinase XerC
VCTTASGRPVGHRNVHRSLQQLCEEVGISPAVSHYELRHTAITHQAETSHTTRQIADWAGTSERMIAALGRDLIAWADGVDRG